MTLLPEAKRKRDVPSRAGERRFNFFSSSASARPGPSESGTEAECVSRYPKGSDLCPRRTKPEEIPVEVRSEADVQIARLTRV